MTGYPLDRLYEEVAFIAYYFHWSAEAILQLPRTLREGQTSFDRTGGCGGEKQTQS